MEENRKTSEMLEEELRSLIQKLENEEDPNERKRLEGEIETLTEKVNQLKAQEDSDHQKKRDFWCKIITGAIAGLAVIGAKVIEVWSDQKINRDQIECEMKMRDQLVDHEATGEINHLWDSPTARKFMNEKPRFKK